MLGNLARNAACVRPRGSYVVESMGGATVRDHRLPRDARRTPATLACAANADVVGGIRISHPERVIYRDLGVSKLDVARYYDAVAEWMLPHVPGRPLTLLRCGRAIDPSADKGGCVMMRHGKAWGPSALRRVRIRELRKTGEYLVADTREALVALAQMGVLEIHTWNADADEPYLHDRVILDLDPGAAIKWNAVVGAAKLIRKMLTAVGLASWVKTTGGKGLHVGLRWSARHTRRAWRSPGRRRARWCSTIRTSSPPTCARKAAKTKS